MIIEDYKDLVPMDNSQKEKFMSFLTMILTPLINLGASVETMDMAFDLYNAAGNQLDVIGELVGVKRLLPYSLASPLVIDNGDGTTTRIYTNELEDEEYRLMIMLKIAKNEWNGTNQQLCDIYQMIFGQNYTFSYFDNQDSSVTFVVTGDISQRMVEMISATDNLIVPAGVGREVQIAGAQVEFDAYVATGVSGIEHIEQVFAT